MVRKNDDVRLIPYEVKAVQNKVDHVPEGVKMVEAEALWNEGFTGEGVVVAVIDTGADCNHPDIKENIIGGYNFTNEGSAIDFQDENGHGTHCIGTICGSKNDIGVVGVAPNAKVLVLKALNKDGSGSFDWIINAIRYAIQWRGPNEEQVKIINMSLGGPYPIPEMEEAIKEAVAEQIAVVVASGNEGDANESTLEFAYPANYNQVISVSASDYKGKLAPFSNNNQEVDLIAPGVDVLSTWIRGQYSVISGTSMATPHVSGAMALLLEKGRKQWDREFTESEMYASLVKHTVYQGYKRTSEGHGLLKLGYMAKVRKLIDLMND